jgi:hypothetical protein
MRRTRGSCPASLLTAHAGAGAKRRVEPFDYFSSSRPCGVFGVEFIAKIERCVAGAAERPMTY